MPPMSRDIVVVHSSDLHVDHDYTARLHGGDGTAGLACVLKAARGVGADVVLLPGNHEPAIPDAVFRHGLLSEVPNLHVLGVTHDEAVDFPNLGLEVWG